MDQNFRATSSSSSVPKIKLSASVDEMKAQNMPRKQVGTANIAQVHPPRGIFPNSSSNLAYINSLPLHMNASSALSDELLLRGMMMVRDPLAYDQIDVAELLRKRMVLAEQQARLEMISKLSALNGQQHSASVAATIASTAVPVGKLLNGQASGTSSMVFASKNPGRKRLEDLWTDGNVKKKAKIEKKVAADTVFPLSESEKKATFPLPSLSVPGGDTNSKEENIVPVGKLSIFRKTWSRLERHSDRTDDTIADQESFVIEFFKRSLHSYSNDHLKQKLRASSLSDYVEV